MARRPLHRDQVYREAFPDVDIVAHAQAFRDLPTEGASNRAQMIKGLPSMIAQLEDALRTGTNLKGADITDEALLCTVP